MVTYDALCHSTRLDQILSGAILPTKDESTVYIDSQRYSCGSTAVNSPVGYWQESLPYALSENRIVTIIAVNGVVRTGLCALGMWLSGKWKWLRALMGLTGIVPLMSAGFLHVVRWSDDSGDAQKLPSWSKIVLATWRVGFIALTMFMVLMIYNRSVYGGPIIGVQGRYFVYMVPIAVLALPQPKWLTVDRSKAGDLGTGMMLPACLLACMVIVTPGLVY